MPSEGFITGRVVRHLGNCQGNDHYAGMERRPLQENGPTNNERSQDLFKYRYRFLTAPRDRSLRGLNDEQVELGELSERDIGRDKLIITGNREGGQIRIHPHFG